MQIVFKKKVPAEYVLPSSRVVRESFIMKEGESLHSLYVASCVCNVFLSFTAILLNSITIHALRKTSSLPKPLKTLLLSLALSDLGVGLIVQPLSIALDVIKLEQSSENSHFYSATYTVFLATVNLFVFASLFGLTALIADRFLAVHLHLRYKELVTHKRVIAVVISIWSFSTVLSLIRLCTPQKISFLIFIFIEVSCFFTTTTLNYKIYVAVQRHTNQIHALEVQQQAQNGEIENHARLRKFAVGTFFVYLTFLVCYLPDFCTFVAVAISEPSTTIIGLNLCTLTLLFLNSSLNPLIYCWKLSHIRHAVVNILRNILRSHNMNEIQPAN